MAIYRLGELVPQIDATAWVADNATVVGNVTLGAGSSVWYGAVVRGDNDRIVIGARTSIQDGCVVHTDPGFVLEVGDGCTIGHQVMLHGCSIGAGTLVGIQAVVMNGARIGGNCIVGAGSVVTEGKSFPDGALIIGSPARMLRMLEPAEVEGLARPSEVYVRQADRHRREARRID